MPINIPGSAPEDEAPKQRTSSAITIPTGDSSRAGGAPATSADNLGEQDDESPSVIGSMWGGTKSVAKAVGRGMYKGYLESTADATKIVMGPDGKPDFQAMEAAKQKSIQDQLERTFGKSGETRKERYSEVAGSFLSPGFGGPKGGVKATIESASAKVRAEAANIYDRVAPKATSGAIFHAEPPKVDPNSLKGAIEEQIRTYNPELLGPGAKQAAATISSKISERAHETAGYLHQSETRMKMWQGNLLNHAEKVKESNEFMNRVLQSKKEINPELVDIRRKYVWWASQMARQNRASGFKEAPRNLQEIFMSAKPGENPEEIMLRHQYNADTATMKLNVLRDLEKYGLARAVPKEAGEKAQAEAEGLFAELDQRADKAGVFREKVTAPSGQKYWIHDHAKAVWDNAFVEQGLWEREGTAGMAFRGLMAAKNTVVPMRLGFSLFHPLHVAHIDNAAYISSAASPLLSGKMSPLRFMSEVGKALPLSYNFWRNPIVGGRLRAAFEGRIAKEALTQDDTIALQHMIDGGFVPTMPAKYRTLAQGAFSKALREHSASALWKAPGAFTGMLMKPLFEHWIPNLKTASYLNDVKNLLKMRPELTGMEHTAERQMLFRKLQQSVDNRYGEMNYETLFWKPMMKDLAVANTLSLGWQMGFIREYGGGMLDVGQFAATNLGEKLAKVKTNQLARPMFVAAYTTTALAYGGLITWAVGGRRPQGLMDYVYPITGTNPDGSPKRSTTMFYTREVASIFDHLDKQGVSGLGDVAKSKSSGLIGMMHDWYTGLDNFNQEYRDPNGTKLAQLQQTLSYTLGEIEPISSKAVMDQTQGSIFEHPIEFLQKAGEDPKKTAMSVAGFTDAPKYIGQTKTQSSILSSFDKYVAPKSVGYDRALYSKDFRQLRELSKRNDPQADTLLDQMQDKYELTDKDRARIEKSLDSETTMYQRLFQRLDWREQKRILDSMKPEEREEYIDYSNKEHLRDNYEPPGN